MKYVISAGGSGGHIYPAIAIINKIKEKDKKAKFLYIGTTNRMEKDIIPNLGIDYVGIKIRGLSKNPINLLKALIQTKQAISKCKKILKDFNPDIAIGVGGYVTYPVIYSAHSLGIKTLLHEQNAIIGKANLLLQSYTDTICVSFSSTINGFKKAKNVVFTGNPRSEEVLNIKEADKKKYGLSLSKKLVVITTGSLGASSVNEKLKEFLKIEDFNYEIVLVTGKSSYDEMKKIPYNKNVKILPYVENLPELLKIADLVISRAGATTIAELTSLGIPSILIPSPYVANNHQYYNAKDLEDKEACIMIEEKDLTKELLKEKIDLILNDSKLQEKLSLQAKKFGVKNSATKIYEEIHKLTSKR